MDDKWTIEEAKLYRRMERVIEKEGVERVLAAEVTERLELDWKVGRIKRVTVFNAILVIGLIGYLIYKRVI